MIVSPLYLSVPGIGILRYPVSPFTWTTPSTTWKTSWLSPLLISSMNNAPYFWHFSGSIFVLGTPFISVVVVNGSSAELPRTPPESLIV